MLYIIKIPWVHLAYNVGILSCHSFKALYYAIVHSTLEYKTILRDLSIAALSNMIQRVQR